VNGYRWQTRNSLLDVSQRSQLLYSLGVVYHRLFRISRYLFPSGQILPSDLLKELPDSELKPDIEQRTNRAAFLISILREVEDSSGKDFSPWIPGDAPRQTGEGAIDRVGVQQVQVPIEY